jgi:hypothetical protein
MKDGGGVYRGPMYAVKVKTDLMGRGGPSSSPAGMGKVDDTEFKSLEV